MLTTIKKLPFKPEGQKVFEGQTHLKVSMKHLDYIVSIHLFNDQP